MRIVRRYFWSLGLVLGVLFSSLSSAQDPSTPSDSIEVIIQGRQYKSIRDYKREQIKNTLKRTLSSHNLMEFSEDELYEIMKEVRKQQAAGGFSAKNLRPVGRSIWSASKNLRAVEEDALDLDASQMQEMLKKYRKEHKGVGNLFLDPDKVKSIIINSQKKPEDTLAD